MVAEEFGGHGGALDVPAGAAGAEGGVPGCLAGLGGLPEGEVAGGVFVVLVYVDAGAVGRCSSRSFLESLPYSGSRARRKYQLPSSVW